MDQTLNKPEGLSPKGERAYDTILAKLQEFDLTNTGGCKAFYSPKQWAERGEEYGLDSELIVVHDGGDLRNVFNYDYAAESSYRFMEQMNAALKEQGLWFECCTCWYAAIYLN